MTKQARVSTGGIHCETSAVHKMLDQHGFAMSEAMLFGLAGGIGFMYSPSGMNTQGFVGGRGYPFPIFTNEMLRRIGLQPTMVRDDRKSAADLDVLLADGPQLVYGDIHYLPYMQATRHFGAHAFVLVARVGDVVVISDRPEQLQQISYRQYRRARTSPHQPFPPEGARIVANWTAARKPQAADIWAALDSSRFAMALGGTRALRRFIVALCRTVNRAAANEVVEALITTFISLELAGSGGAAFRCLFRSFLVEANEVSDGRLQPALQIAHSQVEAWRHFIRLLLPENIASLGAIAQGLYERERLLCVGDVASQSEARSRSAEIELWKTTAAQQILDRQESLAKQLYAAGERALEVELQANQKLATTLDNWKVIR